MPTLAAYSNTENTALVILRDLGYRCWMTDKPELCWGEKDGWDFAADSFTELLGVVRIYEHHRPAKYKEYWWKIDEPWLLESVPTEPPEYTPVWERPR